MGNCISMKDSSTAWGGEEWGSVLQVPREATSNANKTGERENWMMVEKKGRSFHSTTTRSTEVKVKITKKQLAELLSKVDEQQGQSLKHVLTRLIALSTAVNEAPQRSWRPVLQSIPETDLY